MEEIKLHKYIGNIIRFNRIKAKKTQQEVATGICSISHLSKIEKGVYLPNQETLHLLLERIGKKIDFEKDQHQRLVKLIDDFYYHWSYSEVSQMKSTFEMMEKEESHYIVSDYLNRYLLAQLAYELNEKNYEKAESLLYNLDNLEIMSNADMSKFVVLKMSFLNKYKDSKKAAEYAESNEDLIVSDDKAEYFYQKGLIYSYNISPSLSLIHMNKAYESFGKGTNFTRMITCKSVMAINYSRLGLMKEAEKEYIELLRMLSKFRNENMLHETRYNYGIFLKNAKRYEEAFEVFESCEEYFSTKNEHRCLLILAMWETKLHLNDLQEEEILEFTSSFENTSSKCKLHKKYLVYADLMILKSKKNEKEYYRLLETNYLRLIEKENSYIEIRKRYLELLDYYKNKNHSKYQKLLVAFHQNEESMEMIRW